MIDLSQNDLAEVIRILRTYAPGCVVMVFGSRVTGNNLPYSDLDLALNDPNGPLSDTQLLTIKSAFSDSNLPFLVDVLDWHTLSVQFRKVIEQNYVLL